MLSSGLLVLASIVFAQAEVKLPPAISAELEYLTGSWQTEGLFGGRPSKGEFRGEWAPGKFCVVLQAKSDQGLATGIAGWDPATNEVIETWYNERLEKVELRYKVASNTVKEGTLLVHSPNGQTGKGTVRSERQSDEAFVVTAKMDTIEITNRASRVNK